MGEAYYLGDTTLPSVGGDCLVGSSAIPTTSVALKHNHHTCFSLHMLCNDSTIHPLLSYAHGSPIIAPFTYAFLGEDRMLSLSLSKWRMLPSTRIPYSRQTLRLTWTRKQMNSKHHPTEVKRAGALSCEVDAEPLERYRRGGYHPTHLGDIFKDGRYKVIHKLGWGGYATVWLARDFM